MVSGRRVSSTLSRLGLLKRLGDDISVVRADGRGRMRGSKAGAGPGGECVCPLFCETTAPHQVELLCYQIESPKCGTSMIREQVWI